MDGLSAAASGMAVVSLAIQLVGSVRDIRRFMRQVSDAPKELNRLIDLLEQLEVIIEGVGELVEKQRRSAEGGDIDVSPNVLRAMKTCESRLARIENVVEKARKGAKNKVMKSLGAFRIACQKKDIEELEGQLRDAVSILNLTMTMNLTAVHSHNTDRIMANVTETIRKHIVHSGTSPTNVILSSNTRSCTERGARDIFYEGRASIPISGRQSQSLAIYENILGRVYIRRASQSIVFQDDKNHSSEEAYERTECIWLFIPSLFSRCIELRSVNFLGSIQSSLRTYPVIRHDHPVWDMCKTNDVEGLQRLFGNRQISPFSVDPWGRTLLHKATCWLVPEVCRLLFDLGLRGDETDHSGKRPTGYMTTEDELRAVRMIYDLFSPHSDEFTRADLCEGLFKIGPLKPRIEVFREMVDEFVTEQNINEFEHSPIVLSMEMMLGTLSKARGLSDEWMEIIRHLIALGADIHKSEDNGSTLTMRVMDLADHPFDSIYVGDVWLDTLRGARVDDSEYLEVERIYHFERWKSQSEKPLIYQHFEFSEDANKSRFSWDWSISPELSVFDVLNEFKHFGPTQHRAEDDYYEPEELHNWPYVYPDWKYWEECDNAGFTPGILPWKTPKLLESTNIRFERRQRKKVFKLAKVQGLHRSSNMPGTWID